MRTRKRNNILMMTLVCVTVLGLGIGFAAFASNLTIKSTAQVNPDASGFSVVFSNAAGSNSYGSVTASPASMGEPATISESDPTTISGLKAKFTAPEQSVSYTFYARNTGEYLAYLNYITIGDKKCTAGEGTNADMVDNACNGISISVKVKDDEPVTATTGLMSTHTLAAGSNEQVVVTISYAKDSALADGSFSVEFGDVTLTYSTIGNYILPKVCKPVEVATLGNIPTGNYAYGDEYICDPGDGVERTFLVLEDGDTTTLTTGRVAQAGEVSLIMSDNIYESTSLYSDDAIEYVETQLTDWNSVLVSIATANQIAAVVGKTPPSFSDVSLTSAPWLYTNLASDEIYWSTSDYVTGAGKFKDSNWGIATGTNAGVRPVITLSKNDIG